LTSWLSQAVAAAVAQSVVVAELVDTELAQELRAVVVVLNQLYPLYLLQITQLPSVQVE